MHATIWMDVKGIMLNEDSQSQEVTHCMIPFIWYSLKDKTIVKEYRSVVAKG